jgi:cytochrome oxidase Cu insertion factor (SCO1/SenC/PrrC family)
MGKRQLTREGKAKGKRKDGSRWFTWAVGGGLALVIGGLATYLIMQGSGETVLTGKPAPDFTLRLLSGDSVALSSLRGRPVLVSFWHST